MEKYKLRSVIKKKRGGLDVSVNSIVVLIFAVIILSLGIAFIKNMFGKASSQFTDIDKNAKAQMEQQLATSNARVALSQSDIDVSPGKTKVVYLGLKNYLPKNYSFNLGSAITSGTRGHIKGDGSWDGSGSVISCYNFISSGSVSVPDPSKYITFKTLPSYQLKSGESAVLKLLIVPSSSAPAGTYTCKVIIADPSSKGSSKQEYGEYPFYVEIANPQ